MRKVLYIALAASLSGCYTTEMLTAESVGTVSEIYITGEITQARVCFSSRSRRKECFWFYTNSDTRPGDKVELRVIDKDRKY